MMYTADTSLPATTASRDALLNEAAMLLVPLRPGDLQGLVRIRKLLGALASDPAEPQWMRNVMSTAVARLDDVMLGTSPLDAMAEEVGNLIEQAMLGEPVEPVSVSETREPAASAGRFGPAEFTLPAESDRELLPDFIAEALEYLEGAEAALLELEANPGDVEAVNVVFRAFHTIKGTSAFLGLDPIATLAHYAESFLVQVRDGKATFDSVCADLALHSSDTMGELVEQVRVATEGGVFVLPAGYDRLLQMLAEMETRLAGPPVAAPASAAAPDAPRVGDLLVEAGKVDRGTVEIAARMQNGRMIGEALIELGAVTQGDVDAALQTQQRVSAGAEGADSSLRVRTERLDRLVDLVGELVVAQSMIEQDPTIVAERHAVLGRKVSHASKIVRELQGLSMSMRMVPLKPLFQKMQRLVRDVAKKAGKQVELVTEGEETEIDRTMVDLVTDPLVHMVRNAIDHGLERPDERISLGKSATGTVRLKAYHSGDSVVVELSDDGHGLDRERLVAKAISKGLIESGKGMSDNDVYNLIFAPGFSTAEKVTDLSGRGVGMDVVRRNIELLRGRIDIASELGRGTTFGIRLPLTLAITDGMLVRVGAERYIVPTTNIHTSFRPMESALSTVGGRGELVMLHGDIIPIIRLHQLFEVSGATTCPTRGLLVVIGDVNRRYALLVDELLGQQQFVTKPLGDGIGKIQGIAGGAILGDGHVGLILDPAEVIASATQSNDNGFNDFSPSDDEQP